MSPAHGWTFHGVALRDDGTLGLNPSAVPLPCESDAIDGGGASYDASVGLCSGRDPYEAGAYNGRDYYNGGRFVYGTAVSPQYPSQPFDQAIASWVAMTPPGAWLQVHLRVRLADDSWTRWYSMPVWADDAGTIERHAVKGQDGPATVNTDTLVLSHGHTATGYQLSVTLFSDTVEGDVGSSGAGPSLSRLSLSLSGTQEHRSPTLSYASRSEGHGAWGHDLAVPARSQMLPQYRGSAYGGGGEVWCSAASTSMILAYWSHLLHRPDLDQSVPQTVRGVYDWTYEGTGNWPFNVAYAASFQGMDGYVTRYPSLDALEPLIAAGVPVALSIAFAPGVLPGAPIPSSNGHLIVLRGFDRHGDAIVNDPAGPTDITVRRVYPRAALQQVWLSGSRGAAYVIFPQGWKVP